MKHLAKGRSHRRSAALAGLTAATSLLFTPVPAATAAAGGSAAVTVTTDAARYAPGTPVLFTVQLTNTGSAAITNARVTISIDHLGSSTATLSATGISVAAGATVRRTIRWSPPTTDRVGYLAGAELTTSKKSSLGTGWTAVDVSSSAKDFPRYGFVSGYGSGVDAQAVAASLNSFHLNNVQFYDWEHGSHVPLAGTPGTPAPSWTDIAGRTNLRAMVLALLNASHRIGADAYNYNTLYNAWAGYGQDGSGVNPAWGLYGQSNCTDQLSTPLPSGWATSGLYTFNPADPNWQSYINGREKNVFAAYPFDGWHIDQLGDQGTAYTCSGQKVNVPDTYSSFINSAKAATGKKLVFNAVGQFGQQQVAGNPNLSYLYTEAWPFTGQASYNDLATALAQNATWSNGSKNTVLAAYMDQTKCNTAGGTFNPAGVLLTDATIFAHGGDHIELGDTNHMLCAPYFPNNNLSMPDSLTQAMHHYYDFLVAYENLLRDGQEPTTNTITTPGPATSPDGRPGTIWAFARSSGSTDVLHFVNLLGNTTNSWEDADGNDPTPPVQHNVPVTYCYAYGTRRTVNFASPDLNGGASTRLHFTRGSHGNRDCLTFTLPELNYWDMVWITR